MSPNQIDVGNGSLVGGSVCRCKERIEPPECSDCAVYSRRQATLRIARKTLPSRSLLENSVAHQQHSKFNASDSEEECIPFVYEECWRTVWGIFQVCRSTHSLGSKRSKAAYCQSVNQALQTLSNRSEPQYGIHNMESIFNNRH